MGYFSWRSVHFCTIALRVLMAFSNSYIHPDEHFQSLEALAGRMYGIASNEPWEFQLLAPARSFAPLLAVYYIPLRLALWLELLPMQTWYLLRLMFMAVSWVVTDWCLYQMLPTKHERIKAMYFVLTSFVSLVYQSHTFSNSIETVLVVLTVHCINELRVWRSLPRPQHSTSNIISVSTAIGVLFAFGMFNRVTFPVFFVFPSAFFLQCAWKWPYVAPMAAAGFVLTSACCVLIDTIWLGDLTLSLVWENPWNWGQYVVTSYNNLVYNSDLDNLAQHGIHSFCTHMLVNLPQMLGPGLLLLLPRFRNRYWQTTPFLAGISGLVFLSLVPHQELRFLIPIVPLLCTCFDVAGLESLCKNASWIPAFVMNSWLIFNLLMAVLMGIFHQGGVVPALEFIHANPDFASPGTAFVWWRTYSPPTWMLHAKPGTLHILSVNSEAPDSNLSLDFGFERVSVDAMGMDVGKVSAIVEKLSHNYENVYLITPVASFQQNFNTSLYKSIWSYTFHLDMDHLDYSRLQSLRPGLAIYSLL